MLNKVAVVGVGAVGQACALALMLRGSAREIVLIDRTAERATGVATDMRTAYREIVPRIVSEAPAAMLITVTDPPDPLADLTRALAGHDRVLSTGNDDRHAALPSARRGGARRPPVGGRGPGGRRARHHRGHALVVGASRGHAAGRGAIGVGG